MIVELQEFDTLVRRLSDFDRRHGAKRSRKEVQDDAQNQLKMIGATLSETAKSELVRKNIEISESDDERARTWMEFGLSREAALIASRVEQKQFKKAFGE